MNAHGATQTTKTQVPAAAERARLKDGVHIEVSPRRVRAYFDNQLLVDSQKVLLVYETKRPPVYWFPTSEVRMDLLARKAPAAGGAVDHRGGGRNGDPRHRGRRGPGDDRRLDRRRPAGGGHPAP